VTLGGGVSTNLTLSVATNSGDAEEYTATVSIGDNSASTNVTVLAAAGFTVTLDATNSPVAEGETLSVEATVENTGNVEDTQTITLDAGALGTDSTSVTLDGGASTDVTLFVGTNIGDAGEYTATVSSADDSATASVTVSGDAEFVVSDASATYDPSAETATVTYTVTNVGDVAGTEAVTLTATVDDRNTTDVVTLGPGEDTTDDLSIGIDTAGEQELLVRVGNDTVSTSVDPGQADFSITEFEASVSGETASVNYTVENSGGVTDTQDVVFGVNGEQTETATATLTPGESVTGTFEGPIGDTTETTLAVSTDNDSESTTIGVAVTIDEAASRLDVMVDETIEVVAVIENLGGDSLTDEATLAVDGEERDAAPLTIAGGEQTEVSLTVAADASDDGSPAVVSVAGETATTTLSVSGPAVLDVEPDAVQFDALVPPDTATENITLTNDGGTELTVSRAELGATDAFELSAGAIPVGEQTVLAPGESRTVTVEFAPETEGAQSAYLYVESDAPAPPNRVVGITSGPVRTSVTIDGENRTQLQTTVENATAGEQVTIPFPDRVGPGTYATRSVSVTPAVSGDLVVNATASDRSLPTTPETTAGFADNTTRLGNLSITTNRPNDELASVSLAATVDREQLAVWDSDPGNVSFYRFDETAGVWEKRDTQVVELREDVAVIRAQADGFSEWTAAAARPEFSIANTEIDVTSTTAGDDVQIRVFVENTGGTDGTYVAELLLNGETVGSQEAIIADGGEELFQFERTIDEPGTYEVLVNDVFVADVDVAPSSDDETDDSGADDETDTDDGDDSSGDGGDGFGTGFGVVTAVAGLLAVFLGVRVVRNGRGRER
jgi:hypothetical protein